MEQKIKRGGFVRDRRTGAVVKVAESGGRDILVRPAYRSDGYWAPPESLEPVQDPHMWGWWHFAALFAVVAAGIGMGLITWAGLDGAQHEGIRLTTALLVGATVTDRFARWVRLVRD